MIERNAYKKIKEHLEKPEISLLIGPRQAGKTTIMKRLQRDIEAETQRPTLFLNLDIERDARHFTSQEALLGKIHLEIGDKKGVIFIDEIQRKENAGLFLKGLYDMNLGYKWIISGSGSIELKEKIHESLAGRKKIFEITTLSWTEFVHFRTEYRYSSALTDFSRIEPAQTGLLLREYMMYGGYPRVVLEDRLDDKISVMEEIIASYLLRDIQSLLHVKKTDSFSHLVQLLASQTGACTRVEELSKTLGISHETVKNYLWNLENTYIVEKVTPFHRQVTKEISKMPKYYFYDLGLENMETGNFGNEEKNQSFGALFENFVFHLLKEKYKSTSTDIHYWRTKDDAEVDFIIEEGENLIPCEVKYRNWDKEGVPRGLRSFIERYHPKSAMVIHLGTSRIETVLGTEMSFVSWWEL